MVVEYGPERRKRRKRAIQGAAKRRASRSGRVVSYRADEEKPDIPPPLKSQVRRQDRWL